ncbi:MAG: two-component sensor histidine kinase [Citricoccus sp.]|nr:two-component sensor histidine kinase [Citricoccus sp. WCRC_4]
MISYATRAPRSPRTTWRTSFLDAEPVARWLSTVIVLFAVLWFLADTQFMFTGNEERKPVGVMDVVDATFGYGAVALTAWRSTWASILGTGCLVTSMIQADYGAAVTAVTFVTMAVVATAASPLFVKVHLTVYALWSVLNYALHPDEPSVFWGMVALLLVSFLIGASLRHYQHQRRRNEARVRDLEILNQRLREDERQALARDLHDVVADELTLITMQTMSRRRSDDVDELHQVLETVEDAARSGLHELRVLLRLLRNENEGEAPRDVTGAGLSIGSLDHVITSLTASLCDLQFEPEVIITGDLETMPTTLRGTAARILQEAVTNIIKYAPRGTACRIEVTADERELCLNVTNPLPGRNGSNGSASELSSGLGLRGITERVSLLGGRSWSGPEEDQWVLSVCLPVERREAL